MTKVPPSATNTCLSVTEKHTRISASIGIRCEPKCHWSIKKLRAGVVRKIAPNEVTEASIGLIGTYLVLHPAEIIITICNNKKAASGHNKAHPKITNQKIKFRLETTKWTNRKYCPKKEAERRIVIRVQTKRQAHRSRKRGTKNSTSTTRPKELR